MSLEQRIDDHTSQEEDHEPEKCEECENGKLDTGAITPWGEWIEIDCPPCNGTGYKPKCKCGGLGIVNREGYDWAWVDCPDCEEAV